MVAFMFFVIAVVIVFIVLAFEGGLRKQDAKIESMQRQITAISTSPLEVRISGQVRHRIGKRKLKSLLPGFHAEQSKDPNQYIPPTQLG